MARPPSPLDLSLHAHFGILAQRCRGFFRDPDKAAIETRRVPIGRRSPSRDQPLPRIVQSTVQALRLDRQSKQNHRRCQTRAPSVRFDPLVVEFAIPGAPTETIDAKILEDSVHLTAPARDIEYVSALALGWPVKPDKAEATYEHGLLRIEVPLKDPMEGAVKIAIKAGGAETKTKTIVGSKAG